jgi:hypothetical protein
LLKRKKKGFSRRARLRLQPLTTTSKPSISTLVKQSITTIITIKLTASMVLVEAY